VEYAELSAHRGHELQGEACNVAVECLSCGEVLFDLDATARGSPESGGGVPNETFSGVLRVFELVSTLKGGFT
jgi:hypothetical protein